MRLLSPEAEVTRSLSNVIKYPYVNMDNKEAVIIDNNKQGSFVPLFGGGGKSADGSFSADPMEFKTVSQIETEKVLRAAQLGNLPGEGEFKAGLPVTDLDAQAKERQHEAEDKAEQIVAAAREEAEQITKDAAIAADAARASGYEEGKSLGYEEGMAAAEQAIQQKEAELEESARMQQKELDSFVGSIEERYVNVVIALVRKLTGIVIEDKEDLILYLIRTAVNDLEPSANYRIRVSPDDVYYLESHRSGIMDSVGENVSLEFIEEKGLENGQCIIETDNQMVDCGFQTQLEMLVRDLKMLVN